MAANPITEAVLLSADLTSVLLTDAQVRACVDRLAYRESLDAPPSLVAHLLLRPASEGASPWRPGRVLRLTRDDDSVELWRVEALAESATGTSDPSATLRPLWRDLATRVARFTSGAVADVQVFLTGRTLSDALGEILDPENGAPARADGAARFVVGTVDGSLSGRRSDVQAAGATPLDLIEQLCGNAACEYAFRVVPGTKPEDDTYAVDLYPPTDPADATPVATVGNAHPLTDEDARPNTVRLDRHEDVSDVFTAAVPVAAGSAPPVTVAGAEWHVDLLDHDENTNRATLRLLIPERALGAMEGEEPIGPVVADGALVGMQAEARSLSAGQRGPFPIVDSTAPDTIVVEGEDSDVEFWDNLRVLLRDENGEALGVVVHPDLEAEYGRVERLLELPIPPHAERLAAFGVSSDMSAWATNAGGHFMPVGWTKEPGVSVAQETAAGFVINGSKSMRVTAPQDTGVSLGTYYYPGTSTVINSSWGTVSGKPVSVWVAVRLVSGTVDLVIEALSGAPPPADEEYEDEVASVRLVAPSSEPGASPFSQGIIELSAEFVPSVRSRLRLVARDGTAEFVVDAVTVVLATSHQPFAPLTGPRGLWLAAVQHLAREAAASAESWDSDLFDLASVGVTGQEPITAGSVVRVEGDGFTSALAVVTEAQWEETIGEAPPERRVRLGRPRADLRRLLSGLGYPGASLASPYGEPASGQTTAPGSTGGSGSGDGVPTTRTLTLTGEMGFTFDPETPQDLSDNRTWALNVAQDLRPTAAPTFDQLTLTSAGTGTDHAVRADRTLTAGTGLAGGGTLQANRSFALTGQALALHNLASNGLIARTGSGTVAARTIVTPNNGLTTTNGSGVSGNPTIVPANDLAAVEGLTGTGFAARTGTDAWAARTLVAPAAGLTITNTDGAGGNPTFALANDLAALEALGLTGFAVRTAADTWAQRTVTGTTNQVNVANGNGVSGNPVLSLPQDHHTGAVIQFERLGLGTAPGSTASIKTNGLADFRADTHTYGDALPGQHWGSDLGAQSRQWRTLFVGEIRAQILIASEEIATVNEVFYTGAGNVLVLEAKDTDTVLTFGYNNLAVDDFVLLRGLDASAVPAAEFVRIDNGPSPVTVNGETAYEYEVTRGVGFSAHAWPESTGAINTHGAVGRGWIEQYATQSYVTDATTSGPAVVFWQRTGTASPFDIAPSGAVGNLHGLYNFAADRQGAAFGFYTGGWVSFTEERGSAGGGVGDPIGGVEFWSEDDLLAYIRAGTLSLGAGQITYDGTTFGFVGWEATAGELTKSAQQSDAGSDGLLSLRLRTATSTVGDGTIYDADQVKLRGLHIQIEQLTSGFDEGAALVIGDVLTDTSGNPGTGLNGYTGLQAQRALHGGEIRTLFQLAFSPSGGYNNRIAGFGFNENYLEHIGSDMKFGTNVNGSKDGLHVDASTFVYADGEASLGGYEGFYKRPTSAGGEVWIGTAVRWGAVTAEADVLYGEFRDTGLAYGEFSLRDVRFEDPVTIGSSRIAWRTAGATPESAMYLESTSTDAENPNLAFRGGRIWAAHGLSLEAPGGGIQGWIGRITVDTDRFTLAQNTYVQVHSSNVGTGSTTPGHYFTVYDSAGNEYRCPLHRQLTG